MDSRPESESASAELDPTSALLDQVLAADAGEQRALLEQLSARHPDQENDLRERFASLEALGLLDAEDDAQGGGLDIPEQIGDFRLRERLGVGGMGVVFRAHQQSLGRDVALKLVRPDFAFFDTQRRRFWREAEAVARLDHPNIVPVFSVGETRGIPYLAMQYVEGTTLAQLIAALAKAELQRLDGRAFVETLGALVPAADRDAVAASVRGLDADWVTVTASVLLQVTDALAHAHARGIMHRDVKPSNIMVGADGRSLLVDFGLATLEGHAGSITRSGALLGSLPYMSPEQVHGGEVDQRSDVFAVGCVLYEMLTLQPAFESATAEETVSKIVSRDPPDLRRAQPAVHPDFVAIVAKCLEKKPERRYQSPSEVAGDLRALLEHRPVSAQRLTPWVQLARFTRREPLRAWLYAVCTAAALVISGLGGYLIARQDEISAGQQKIAADRFERALSRAYLALEENERDRALEQFERVLALRPACYEAAAGLAYLRGEAPPAGGDAEPSVLRFAEAFRMIEAAPQGDREAARRALELMHEAVLLAPAPRPLFYGYLARAAAEAGDEATARRTARALRALWPDRAMPAFRAGNALFAFDPAAAADHLEDAIALSPELAAAHADLGALRLRLGQHSEALDHLQQAVELDGDNGEALIALGVALGHLGQTDRAIATLRRATGLRDPRPGAFFNLGVYLAQSDSHDALLAFYKTVEMAPDYADAWGNIGALLYQRGDFAGAARAFGRRAELRPDSAESFRDLGAACAQAEDAIGAVKAYQRVVELAPRDSEAHVYLCSLLEHLDDSEALDAERERFAAHAAGGKKP